MRLCNGSCLFCHLCAVGGIFCMSLGNFAGCKHLGDPVFLRRRSVRQGAAQALFDNGANNTAAEFHIVIILQYKLGLTLAGIRHIRAGHCPGQDVIFEADVCRIKIAVTRAANRQHNSGTGPVFQPVLHVDLNGAGLVLALHAQRQLCQFTDLKHFAPPFERVISHVSSGA